MVAWKSNYKSKSKKVYTPKRIVRKPVVSKPVQRFVKNQLNKNIELKVSWQSEDEQAAGSVNPLITKDLTSISQGVTADTRIGNQIKLVSHHVRGFFNNNSVNPQVIRMLLLKTALPADIAYATTELFLTTAGAATTPSASAGLNLIYAPVNKKKFTVLQDRVFKIGASTALDASNVKQFNIFTKLNGTRITYDSTTSGQDNQNYRYHLMFLSADANDDATVSTCEMSYSSRLWYTDA